MGEAAIETAAALGLPEVPGPRYRTPFGAPRVARDRPLEFIAGMAKEFGDIVCMKVGPFWSYFVFHADHIKHILQDNNQNYWKGIIVGRAKPLIGEGLFTSEGDFWRRQRRLAQPAFHRQRIASFASAMTDCAAAMLESWAPLARRGESFDASSEMSRVTLRVVGKALFSVDLQDDAAEVGRALLEVLDYVNERAFMMFPLPVYVPTPRNLRFRRDRRALDRVVYRIIEARRSGATDAGDLLAMLMSARDEETGEGMSDRQIRDEVMTFVLAGHETTALTLTWTWYLLAQNPGAEARLRSEVDEVLGGDRVPTVEDLPALRYARMVVEEAMRLYPPLWAFGRQTIGEDQMGGYRIRANAVVSIFPYFAHRHPDLWEDPERFDPERFTPERVAARPRFAYLPFSGGPRQCIGNEFALMEAQLILAMVVQRYRLRPVPDRPVEPEVRLTLRPRGGLHVTLEPVG